MTSGAISCPQCRKLSVWEGNDNRPFCSERCRLVDLGAWASENYRIAAEPLPETDDIEE